MLSCGFNSAENEDNLTIFQSEKTELVKIKMQFTEPLSTAVFTSVFVIEGNQLITNVSHELEDSAWQFHSNDQLEGTHNARVVGLGQIIEMDSSLLEIANLPLGYKATRNSANAEWKISN